jgi:peptide-methionine (S)-S-oxide reductase
MLGYTGGTMRHIIRILATLSLFTVEGCNATQASQSLPNPSVDERPGAAPEERSAVLAGGCFWGVEAVFEHVKGVKDVVSGYSGGEAATAHYEIVSGGATGHAESVKVTYDPSQISYGQLLKVYFSVAHDPTELNRQGPDEGTQYRSAIFFANEEQKRIASAYVDQLNKAKVFSHPIVTQITPLKAFYNAEGYHQNYLAHHRDQLYIVINDLPKIEHLQKQFPELYVNREVH